MIKNIKFSFLIITSTILLSSCGSVQKAFDPQNKNTSEEFLVEKKSPLSMPPSYEELPIPSSEKIDKEIEKLIKEAIAASNRKKAKSNNFSLTPEALALAKSFELNKGKLPWPVSRGVVIQKFGTQPHPVVRTAKIKSNGIVIATEKSAKVKTVFKGVVLSVLKFRGSNPTVLVQHGNYITAYKNLAKVFVEKGDNLDSGQVIGEVYNNESLGKSTLQFSVFKKTTPLNPIYWILKM